MTSQQKRETSFAIMLFSVVIVFLFCSVDYLILDVLTYIGISYHSLWDNLGNILLSLNSAVNFVIYCVFGRKFRKEFFLFIKEITRGKLFRNTVPSSASRGLSSAVMSGRLYALSTASSPKHAQANIGVTKKAKQCQIVSCIDNNNFSNRGIYLSTLYVYFFSARLLKAILFISGTDHNKIANETTAVSHV